MKKFLLLLLLLPLLSFGQNVQLGLEMFQNGGNDEFYVVDADNPIEEGLLLEVGLHMSAVGSDDFTLLADSRYLFVDIQYNSQILSLIDEAYDFPALDLTTTGGTIEERYTFSNTSISQRTNDLKLGYNRWQSGEDTYSEQNAKWSVVRVAIQLSDAGFDAFMDEATIRTEEPLFNQVFQVKTGTASITEQEMFINFATIDNVDDTQVTSLYTTATSYPHPVIESVSYNAKLHFDLPEAIDPTNFQVTVYEENVLGDSSRLPVTLDAAGDALIPDVDLDKTYFVSNLDPIDRSYLPDVHTVTDAYRSFKYLNDVGINGTDVTYNNFGLFSADANLNGEFTSYDVYGLFAYVLGMDVQANGGQGDAPGDTFCLPFLDENGVWYHGCTATVLYENYTIEKLGAELDINNTGEESGQYWNSSFTPTEDNLNFDFAFWHHVDLDQSHSSQFPATLTAKASKAGLSLSNKAVGTTALDMVSKIEGDKVLVELTHNGSDIVGLQARIKYDTSKLKLENIIYDTGNTVTNFSKNLNGELLFGGLSTDGSENIKKGKAFTIEFTPIGTVNNTTGLFYFENTDAVKQNGDKMTLKIQ
ncbi:hypothetical protein PQZ39_00040 [bacterium]|nr:hypothetical protein [bacterium]